MERPAYPGEGAGDAEWDQWKAANETRRQRQIEQVQRYIDGASEHEQKLIAGRTAEELVESADNLYRTDVEIAHYKQQRETQQRISGLWDGYLALEDEDWQGKRQYIADNPEFEQILKDRADERGKAYWWTESRGDVIERKGDGSIVRHSRPTDEQWDAWNATDGSEEKLSYLNANPAFATYYLAMYQRKGYEPWWEVDENGKFIRKSRGTSDSGRSGQSRSRSGSGPSRGTRSSGSSNRSSSVGSGPYPFRPYRIRPRSIRARRISRDLQRSILRPLRR
jgi:uncharacterized membrane protein YgcG